MPLSSIALLLTISSPHAEALERNQHVPPFDFPSLGVIRGGGPAVPRANRVVYGYYPYWVSAWENLRWDLLTHIAFFAIEMNADGTLANRHGWPDQDFVDTAHMFGVKAEVSFTLFSGSGIRTLCSSDTNRARGINNMIDEMEAGGADGINVDFEALSQGTRDCFTQYIRELRETLQARGHMSAGVSLAAPAVDWTNEFDLAELQRFTDVFFIMGYGYHWTRSGKPGPVGQLRVTESWRPHVSISMQRTIAHYTGLVAPDRRSVIVFGVPYYGREWPVTAAAMHSPTTGDGASRTYSVARRAIEDGQTRLFDPDSMNPWYVYQNAGSWRQVWYDDEESLAAKYDLALEQEIGGVGMWALGYDGAYPELWDTLETYFTSEPESIPGMRSAPIDLQFPAEISGDTRTSPSNYFNAYACAPNLEEYGREIVYQFEVCGAGILNATVEDGAGVDIDLHLLDDDVETACVARDDRTLSIEVGAGRHLLVADSYVSNQVPQEGAFTLRATFTPTEPGCGPRERCFEGRCVGQVVEPNLGVDVTTSRTPDPILPAAETPTVREDPDKGPPATVAEGCSCRTSNRRSSSGLWMLLSVALIARRFTSAVGPRTASRR